MKRHVALSQDSHDGLEVTPILLLPLLWLRLRRVPAKGAWCGAAITVIGTALILSR